MCILAEVARWDQIHWKRCERQVQRLQTRIVKASQDGTLGQGQSLATAAHLLVQRQGPGRETSDGKQGQTNSGRGSRSLVRAAIQTQSHCIFAAPGISTAATTAGVHPQSQRKVAAAGHSDDEGPGHAGPTPDGLGTHRRNLCRPQLLWFPTRPLHGGRYRTVLQCTVASRRTGMGS